ncbi:MAG: TRAP transporter small permease [Lachnospiraceae bacterium]|nr:TRAP transporter small permease [Lachnospiraceae bacterium]MBO4559640.1 TRAP transporter small permease [Lachnospiraceae bacterium]MBR5733272.1 TRAP transporter small permease [Lachnospiraceae bacterium]
MKGFLTSLDRLKPVYDTVYKAVLFICKIFLIGDILITCMAVLGRFVPFIPDPAWTEEVVLTLMTYMAVLSAALAIRKGSHIRMTSFDKYIPKKVLNVLDLIADIAVLALGVVMLIVGWKYAVGIGAKGTYISMPSVSKFWMYFPVPVAGFAMIIFELEAIYRQINKMLGAETAEAGKVKAEPGEKEEKA